MADANALEALKPVASGDLIVDVCTAARMNAITSLLKALITGGNLSAGEGIEITKSGNFGVMIGLKQAIDATTEKTILDRLDALETRINNLKANVVCNPDGSFTVSFT